MVTRALRRPPGGVTLAGYLCVIALCGQIGCGRSVPPFDAERAYEYLLKQCEFGPRVPGSQSHADCLSYLSEELRKFGAQVHLQQFTEQPAGFAKPVTMTNIIASFGVEKTSRILLCAHWDSRPWADADADSANHGKPVPGANDGASGVAVLLEVARNLSLQNPRYGVDIILFDGEDAGSSGRDDSYALGAQFFARNKNASFHPRFGILLDMVGDSDLQIYQEGNSLRYANDVVQQVWARAGDLGLSAFKPSSKFEVNDDHVYLLQAGIPCIDLIDFDYEHWHTISDTPDKCDAQSLAQVGTLLLSLIYD